MTPRAPTRPRGVRTKALSRASCRIPTSPRRPPKSTGREVYGADFARSFIESCSAAGLSFEDQVATATAFTAESIARAYRDFILPETKVAAVIVAGGGSVQRDPPLPCSRPAFPGCVCSPAASLGIPVDAREAMAFAVLGHESLMGPAEQPARSHWGPRSSRPRLYHPLIAMNSR